VPEVRHTCPVGPIRFVDNKGVKRHEGGKVETNLGRNILDYSVKIWHTWIMAAEPITLQQAVVYFASPDNCREYIVPRRWPNGVTCPTCGSSHATFQPKHTRWQCTNRHPRRQFTLKTGTVMEDSPIGMDKWLTAMWLVASNRNGISSWELHRALGITQKTAWFLLHRVRLAMQDDLSGGMLGGEVEIDETFIGGKARNMHKSKKDRIAAAHSGTNLKGGAGKGHRYGDA
jgi:transposase-like protein